jgi:hypothetical protein
MGVGFWLVSRFWTAVAEGLADLVPAVSRLAGELRSGLIPRDVLCAL